ncbi:MAG TPA: PQQ-dependent dehydrogenase, methanol/ethanol family [Candidatus Acidoferrales bacterium]|nr:PQQ-dependent dehydrogenase, methanol/ethanol family [Candidatus Acidoferrales bacterium]
MRLCFCLLAPALLLAQVQVPFERIRAADQEPGNWLTYSRDYSGRRYSPLDQVNTGNVNRLHVAWMRQVDETDTVETSPIVVDGTLYVTEPPGTVEALDGVTGRTLWRYRRELPRDLRLCCGKVNRGLAILGDSLYYATTDAHLIALDARTGALRWDVTMADYKKGYSSTGAPLAVKDKIITGMAGGEFGVTGFIDGYDARTGKRAWRFTTIPGKGEPGNETWAGESWKTGSATTWVTGVYDPESNTVYWGTGNPGPDWNGDVRKGDNLYADCLIALDPDTGAKKWHFQYTPHDVNDWDSTQTPILVDGVAAKQPRKMVVLANRNGFYYALDRLTGKFIAGRAYVKQTWATGLDEAGRPMRIPGAEPTEEGKLIWPNLGGGSNWYSSTYNPKTNLYYVNAKEEAGIYHKGEAEFRSGALFNGGGIRDYKEEEPYGAVRALDVATGELRWEYRLHRPSHAGLMASAGGLVFGSNLSSFFALDAEKGALLWRFETGGGIDANPVTYMASGKQYVLIAAGHAILVFALD